MDALPIKEDNGLDFSSTKTGKDYECKAIPLMHACGHDIHTTMLLGAASALREKKFNGIIKFIFQPSEEGTNGDEKKQSGGQKIVENGELDDVIAAVGLHVMPLLEVANWHLFLDER